MTVDVQNSNWFLAQLKPNCSKIAERNLKRQGFTTLLPLAEETRKRNGKFVTTKQPLFPGYIFVAFDVARGLWRSVNSTYGITKLVSFGSAPATVPTGFIDELRSRCDDHGAMLPPQTLQSGEQVTMIKGPFANLLAKVESVAPDQRVWLLMDIMGRETRVAARADQLKRA